jgi:hypothetical protein
LYIGERDEGPIFVPATGHRLTRHAADRTRKRLARRVGIPKLSGSRAAACATRSSPPPSTRVWRCATSKRPPHTPTHAPRCDTTVDARASTVTPPTWSPRSRCGSVRLFVYPDVRCDGLFLF